MIRLLPADDEDLVRGELAAGVRGFVPKTTPAARLAAIVRDVHAGARYVDHEIVASALTEDTCPLTGRELDVLRYAHDGRPVADIAVGVHLAAGTVRHYLSSAEGETTRLHAVRGGAARMEGWI